MIVILERDRRALAFALRIAIENRYLLADACPGDAKGQQRAIRDAKRFEQLLAKVEA